MAWFTFDQNNTGGSFDHKMGHYVCIEARDAHDANSRAESIGIYFNGCEDGEDCPCCGDRWYRVDDNDAHDQPKIYSRLVDMSEPLRLTEGDKKWKEIDGIFVPAIQVVPLEGESKFFLFRK